MGERPDLEGREPFIDSTEELEMPSVLRQPIELVIDQYVSALGQTGNR